MQQCRHARALLHGHATPAASRSAAHHCVRISAIDIDCDPIALFAPPLRKALARHEEHPPRNA